MWESCQEAEHLGVGLKGLRGELGQTEGERAGL